MTASIVRSAAAARLRRGPGLREQTRGEGRTGRPQGRDVAGAAVAPDGDGGALAGFHQLQAQPLPVVPEESDSGHPAVVVLAAARQRRPREQARAVVRPADAPPSAALGLVHGVLEPVRRQGFHEHRLAVGQRRDDDVGGGGRRSGRRHAHQDAAGESREVVGRFRQGGRLFDELPAAEPRQPARIHRRGGRLRGCDGRQRRRDGRGDQRQAPRRARPRRARCFGTTSPGCDRDGHVSPPRVERHGSGGSPRPRPDRGWPGTPGISLNGGSPYGARRPPPNARRPLPRSRTFTNSRPERLRTGIRCRRSSAVRPGPGGL